MISSDVTVPFFFFSKKSVLHKHEKSRQFELTSKKIQVFATKVHIFVLRALFLNVREVYFLFLENMNL